MLLLLFEAGNERFGLDAADVIEVTPLLACRALPHAPPYVSGLTSYRGASVPVIDLSALLTGQPAPSLLSTRLVLVRYGSRVLALRAARAIETLRCSDGDFQQAPVRIDSAPYLGPLIVDAGGRMIQKVDVATLLSPAVRDGLFSPENG